MVGRVFRVLSIILLCQASFNAVALAQIRLGTRISLGVGYGGYSTNLDSASIPAAVVEEAANPTIINHYTGHSFNVDKIGAYDPANIGPDYNRRINSSAFISAEVQSAKHQGLYLKGSYMMYTPTYNSTNGQFNQGYGYAKMLGGNADMVMYLYGVHMKYARFVPEAGVSIAFSASPESHHRQSMRFGLSLRERTTNFYKGLEAYSKPEGWTKIATLHERTPVAHLGYAIEGLGIVSLEMPIGKKFCGTGITISIWPADETEPDK